LNNLAWILATCPIAALRNGDEAVQLAAHACKLTRDTPVYMGTLAAAYAEAGDFSKALTTAQEARSAAEQKGEKDLALKNGELDEMYSRQQAYRDQGLIEAKP
jgi:hypothetical protein